MAPNSLTFRLVASALFYALLALPLTGYAINTQIRSIFENDFDLELQRDVDNIYIYSRATSDSEPRSPAPELVDPLYNITKSGYYWEIRPAGTAQGKRWFSDSLATEALPTPLIPGAKPGKDAKFWRDTTGPYGQRVRVVATEYAFSEDPGSARFVYTVGRDLDFVETKAKALRDKLIVDLAMAAMALAGILLLQLWVVLTPLRAVQRGLLAVRTGKAEKLEGELPAEIEPLQRELNALITNNHDIIERARTQVGNLAHSLKTPLAVIVNDARDEKSPFGERVAEQADTMRNQINHYLERARVAARAGTIGRATEVRPVLEGLQRALTRIWRDKPVAIDLTCSPKATFQGERQDIEEALGNLIDNACRYSRGRVRITADVTTPLSRTDVPKLVIAVDDDGPGLSAEDRAKLGKRGVRLDESQPGSGLGLAIVADLAQSYRGQFRLEASDLGGLSARLELPTVVA